VVSNLTRYHHYYILLSKPTQPDIENTRKHGAFRPRYHAFWKCIFRYHQDTTP